jgi:hypothetical protein
MGRADQQAADCSQPAPRRRAAAGRGLRRRLAAAALWRAAIERWHARATTRFVVYLLVALLHATGDSVGSDWMYTILALIGFGLLTWTTHRLARPPLQLEARPATIT